DNRPDDVVQHLSNEFEFVGLNRTLNKSQVRDAIKDGVRHYGVEALWVSQFEVEELSQRAGLAKVKFRLHVSLQGGRGGEMFWCRSQFIREDGKWRMKSLHFYNPFVKTDQPLQLHLP